MSESAVFQKRERNLVSLRRSSQILATIFLLGLFFLPSFGFAEAWGPPHVPITLTSQNPQGGYFGSAIATSGSLIAVGAYDKDLRAPSAGLGAVYLFNTNGRRVQNFTAPNDQGGEFGFSVSLSGSLLVVGAPQSTFDSDASAGLAYAYNTTTSLLMAILSSPHAQSGGMFGYSVAASGDTIVVGAPNESVGTNSDAGNVYVFNLQSPGVGISISNPNPTSSGTFGSSVSISGNYIVAGAPGLGFAYLLSTDGTMIKAFHVRSFGYYGSSVSIDGGLIVVGQFDAKVKGIAGAGRAYIYDYNGKLVASLQSPNPNAMGEFGWSVMTNGTLVLVGSIGSNENANDSAGQAFEFNSTGALIGAFHSYDSIPGGQFGYSTSIGVDGVVIGAPGQQVNGVVGAGVAYYFHPESN